MGNKLVRLGIGLQNLAQKGSVSPQAAQYIKELREASSLQNLPVFDSRKKDL